MVSLRRMALGIAVGKGRASSAGRIALYLLPRAAWKKVE
jgi:hypothetical protein